MSLLLTFQGYLFAALQPSNFAYMLTKSNLNHRRATQKGTHVSDRVSHQKVYPTLKVNI